MPDYSKVIVVRNEVCSLKGILSSPVGNNFFPHGRKQKISQANTVQSLISDTDFPHSLLLKMKTLVSGNTLNYSQLFKGCLFYFLFYMCY